MSCCIVLHPFACRTQSEESKSQLSEAERADLVAKLSDLMKRLVRVIGKLTVDAGTPNHTLRGFAATTRLGLERARDRIAEADGAMAPAVAEAAVRLRDRRAERSQ